MKAVILSILIVSTVCVSGTLAPVRAEHEYQVKATYLYHFARFIRWPASAFPHERSPLNICVVGENPFGEALDELAQCEVRKHPIAVKVLAQIDQRADCHMLFFSEEVLDSLSEPLDRLDDGAILTLADDADFVRSGGMIQFVTAKDRINFIVNLDAARNECIQIDSQLLSLAAQVIEGGL